MKLSVALLGLLVAVCHSQMPPVKDPYQPVTYNVPTSDGLGVCATFTLAGQFIVPYNRVENDTSTVLYNVEINLPMLPPANESMTQGTIRSTCPMPTGNNNDTWFSQLHITFSDYNAAAFIMNVNATGTNGMPTSWMVTSIEFVYNQTDSYYFPDGNGTDTAVRNMVTDPDTIDIRSSGDALFRCNAQSTLQLEPASDHPQVEFHLMNLLLNPLNNTVTDPPISECSADKSSSTTDKTVPIAVGSALGGLLILVLIAYLIGRRMRRSAGYQKV